MSTNGSEEKMKELSKQLVGKEVTLAPSAAIFIEDNEQYVLNAYGKQDREIEFGSSSVIIEEGWKLRPTMRNIRAGVLRVLDPKTKEDISVKFDGPATPPGRNKKTPLVINSSAPVDPNDQRDIKLKQLLGSANVETVMNTISSAGLSYDALERLLELEIQGENPAYRSRRDVVDGITTLIKNTSGMGQVKIEEEETKTITRK